MMVPVLDFNNVTTPCPSFRSPLRPDCGSDRCPRRRKRSRTWMRQSQSQDQNWMQHPLLPGHGSRHWKSMVRRRLCRSFAFCYDDDFCRSMSRRTTVPAPDPRSPVPSRTFSRNLPLSSCNRLVCGGTNDTAVSGGVGERRYLPSLLRRHLTDRWDWGKSAVGAEMTRKCSTSRTVRSTTGLSRPSTQSPIPHQYLDDRSYS